MVHSTAKQDTKRVVNCSYTTQYMHQNGQVRMEDHLWSTATSLF